VAEYVGKPAAMVVGMGFATNSLVIPAIVGKGDLLLSDEQNHRSIAEGARMSGAKIKPFRCVACPSPSLLLSRSVANHSIVCPLTRVGVGELGSRHNDAEHLEELLQEALMGPVKYGRVLVLVEGIYSMEGELCDLPAIVKVAKRYKAYVYLDEAHSIGAVGPTGRGVCEELGVDTADVDIMMGTLTPSLSLSLSLSLHTHALSDARSPLSPPGTFTKSFGAAGGYVAASHELVARLREHSAGCMDAVSMPPAVCVQVCVPSLTHCPPSTSS
jgi:serine palmitoyltransferase